MPLNRIPALLAYAISQDIIRERMKERRDGVRPSVLPDSEGIALELSFKPGNFLTTWFNGVLGVAGVSKKKADRLAEEKAFRDSGSMRLFFDTQAHAEECWNALSVPFGSFIQSHKYHDPKTRRNLIENFKKQREVLKKDSDAIGARYKLFKEALEKENLTDAERDYIGEKKNQDGEKKALDVRVPIQVEPTAELKWDVQSRQKYNKYDLNEIVDCLLEKHVYPKSNLYHTATQICAIIAETPGILASTYFRLKRLTRIGSIQGALEKQKHIYEPPEPPPAANIPAKKKVA